MSERAAVQIGWVRPKHGHESRVFAILSGMWPRPHPIFMVAIVGPERKEAYRVTHPAVPARAAP